MVASDLADALSSLKERSLEQAVPGLELLDVLGMSDLERLPPEVEERELSTVEIEGSRLFVLRLRVPPQRELTRPALGLWAVRNELSPPRRTGSVDLRMDFLFDSSARLISVLPVPGTLRDAPGMRYLQLGDLWMDMRCMQPSDPRAMDRHAEAARLRSSVAAAAGAYLIRLFGARAPAVEPCGRTSYVYECEEPGGPRVRQLSFDELGLLLSGEDCHLSRQGRVYVVLPTTYVPGGSVDIGFYDAIGGTELDLSREDLAFVIGCGSGVDLILAARRAAYAYSLEVNPFAVASARTNLAVAGLRDRALVDWGDLRDLAVGSRSMPLHLSGKITRVLWNMAYESSRVPSSAPLLMADFHDGYAVLDWFIPFLAHTPILAPDWRALLWNIVRDEGELERRFAGPGLRVRLLSEGNTCVVSPTRGAVAPAPALVHFPRPGGRQEGAGPGEAG